MEARLRATERHLPYGITQCYLPPDRGERTPPQPQPDRPVLDLPTLEGWKAELTYSQLCTSFGFIRSCSLFTIDAEMDSVSLYAVGLSGCYCPNQFRDNKVVSFAVFLHARIVFIKPCTERRN